MLSATYTIDDIKAALKKDYDFYDYTSDEDFEADLTLIVNDVALRYFYPRITKTRYDEIADKDKTGIDFDNYPEELYLYWAEVYTVCYEFNKFKNKIDNQLQNNSNETLKVEGYSYSLGAGGSSSPGDESMGGFWEQAYEYWKLAGFDLHALSRTCTIFGDSDDYRNSERTIIQ